MSGGLLAFNQIVSFSSHGMCPCLLTMVVRPHTSLVSLLVFAVVVSACRRERARPNQAPAAAKISSDSEATMDIQAVAGRMDAFAKRTGVGSGEEPTRYLWTDAFAVCNDLGLARLTGEQRYLERARLLVDQVHHVLGRHRADTPRDGWISGYSETEGEEHPTAGGLRIGKPLPERKPEDPFDERLEWERDGQYFHYLTKWMHALDLMTRETGEARYNVWARELAERAYDRFTYSSGRGGRRMYWKMSIDLSRPQVPSMGAHDPLDGWVTYRQLEATADTLPDASETPGLEDEIAGFDAMLGRDFATTDPLGLGGLLMDAVRLAQIDAADSHPRLAALLRSALRGLKDYVRHDPLDGPASRRLAFRELGLAIGLSGVAKMERLGIRGLDPELDELLVELQHYTPLAEQIVAFWSDPRHQAASTWIDHRDINEVMLVTAQIPSGCLTLAPHAGTR